MNRSGFNAVLFAGPSPGLATGVYSLAAATGSYTEVGASSTPVHARFITGVTGSYSESGLAALPVHARFITGGKGSYSESGLAALPVHSRFLTCGLASYTSSGLAASIRSNRHLVSATGVYLQTGLPATIQKISGKFLIATLGAYLQTGLPAVPKTSRFLSAAPGGYLQTGLPAVLKTNHFLGAAAGIYHQTGLPAAVQKSIHQALGAAQGAYLQTGRPAALTGIIFHHFFLLAGEAAYHVYGGMAATLDVPRLYPQLGRFRHGDKVTLAVTLQEIPDAAPIAVLFNPSGQAIGAYPLPSVDSTNLNFALPVQMGLGFSFGTYLVSYQFTIGGVPGSAQSAQFQVIPGGDAGGEVIFMYALDRPEATFVLTQLDSGRLCVGRNPSIGT